MNPAANENKGRGAKVSKTSIINDLHSWWRHHRDSCSDSLSRLLHTPFQSLMTWMVIAVAIALPAALYLGLKNMQELGDGWQDNAQMSVFLQREAQNRAIDNLQKKLEKDSDIASIARIDPGKALIEFQQYSGLGDVLQDLDENPLPTVFIIQPVARLDSPDKLSDLKGRIQVNSIVESVQLDMGWLRRLHELLALGERVVFALASLLSLGVLLVIGNTLRLAIENRRDEIIVVKMVGGTDGFVRRPFLYTGLWYGLGGGLMAFIMLTIIGLSLSSPVSNLVNLYESDYSLYGLNFSTFFKLLGLSAFLGWLGAWLAVSRHLKGIEPH